MILEIAQKVDIRFLVSDGKIVGFRSLTEIGNRWLLSNKTVLFGESYDEILKVSNGCIFECVEKSKFAFDKNLPKIIGE